MLNTKNRKVDISLDGISSIKYHVVTNTKITDGVIKILVQFDFDSMPVDLDGNTAEEVHV